MTQGLKGLPYLVSNSRGYQIPFYPDEDYMAHTLAGALSGDKDSYDTLCADNLWALGKYDAIIAAIREKYGYAD